MDSDYSEENQSLPKKKFTFKAVQPQCALKPTVSSILIESYKSKPIFPQIILKKLCEQSGLECSEDTFFTLLSSLTDFALTDLITGIKETKQVSKYKKDGVLQSSEVQNELEQRDVYLSQPKIITEMAINENTQAIMLEEE